MDIRKLQKIVVSALEDIKGKEIEVINTTKLTSMFDRLVIAAPPKLIWGKNFVIGSESASFPSCASRSTSAAVNCLVTDPISNTCSGATGIPRSICAIPYPLRSTTSPFHFTSTAAPGASAG